MNGQLILKDGTHYIGTSFGANILTSGEVVFATGMVGYPESLTDPSFRGQILVYTYPLIGNYGVPDKKLWESGRLQISGLIVCNYNPTPSHYSSKQTLSDWLKKEKIPALEIKDTRRLTLKLREQGVMLGKIDFNTVSLRGVPNASEGRRGNPLHHKIASTFAEASNFTKVSSDKSADRSVARPNDQMVGQALAMTDNGFEDPNLRNLVAEVSCKKPYVIGSGKKTVALIDCGAKLNIAKSIAKRGLKVVVVPWNLNPLKLKVKLAGVVISNGPGNPEMADAAIANVKQIMVRKMPILGICLGNQILALAAGGTTYKLKFGHRGQNQPAVLSGTKKAYLTTQNHGFAVGKIPAGFKEWFYNANDNTNEGIIHKTLPFMSVQFHPEATPGPTDADWIFDYFLKKVQ